MYDVHSRHWISRDAPIFVMVVSLKAVCFQVHLDKH